MRNIKFHYDYVVCFLVLIFIVFHDLKGFLISGTYTTHAGEDMLSWYGVFQYFFESASDGVLPYWNPYSHGGEPFYLLFSLFRLLDPLIIIPVILTKLFSPDLLYIYHWHHALRLFLFLIGEFLLVKYLFKDKFITFVLFIMAVTPIVVTSTYFSTGKMDTICWVPWIMLFVIRAYGENSGRMILIASYFLGMYIGASNYHFLFFLTFCLIFLFFFIITDYRGLWSFLKGNSLAIIAGSAVVCLLSLPLFVAYLDKGSIFPVLRLFGVRYLLDQFLSTGSFYQPFEKTFSTSAFAGKYIQLNYLKDYFLSMFLNRHAGELLFLLCGILISRFKYRIHLFLTCVILALFAAGDTFIYRFFYKLIPLLKMIRHTDGYIDMLQTLKLIFIGYGIFAFLEVNQERKWYRVTVVSAMLIIFYYAGLLISKYYYLLVMPLFFIPFDKVKGFISRIQFHNLKIPDLTREALFVVILFFVVIGHYNGGFIKFTTQSLRTYSANALNPIYNNDFRPKPITYNPSRILCLPRPGFILLESYITKISTAASTFLEPPTGKTEADIPYLKLCKDSVVGPRDIYWPRDYTALYLLGEKNINSFLDLMGVDDDNIRFYSTDNVFKLDKQSVLKFFDNYYHDTGLSKKRVTENILFIEPTPDSYANDAVSDRIYKTIEQSSKAGFAYEVLRFNANRIKIKVNAPTDGFLLYNDTYDKHWRAYVNGTEQKVLVANTAFKSIELKKGEVVVEFKYKPVFFDAAVKIYILINVIFCTFFMYAFFRRLKKQYDFK